MRCVYSVVSLETTQSHLIKEVFGIDCLDCLNDIQEFCLRHLVTPLNMQSKNQTVIVRFICQSNYLIGGTKPFKAAKIPIPSAISLKIWLLKSSMRQTLHKTNKMAAALDSCVVPFQTWCLNAYTKLIAQVVILCFVYF